MRSVLIRRADPTGSVPCDTPRMAKRPRDFAQRAKFIIDIATGQVPPDPAISADTALTERGRKGGLKGGKARARKLPASQRKAIAKKAARARWRRR